MDVLAILIAIASFIGYSVLFIFCGVIVLFCGLTLAPVVTEVINLLHWQSLIKCIDEIEKYPHSSDKYKKIILSLKESEKKRFRFSFEDKYSDRIFKICETNSGNILAWQVLKEVVIRFGYGFKKIQVSKLLTLLVDSDDKEFRKTPVKIVIAEIIVLLIIRHYDDSRFERSEIDIQYLYNRNKDIYMKFFAYCLSRSYMRLLDIDKKLYFISVPIEIDYFPDDKEKCKVNFISFLFDRDKFFVGGTNYNDYRISVLFNTFLSAIKDEDAKISMERRDYYYESGTKYIQRSNNRIIRELKVLLYSSNDSRVAEFRALIKIYKEFADIGLEMQKTDTEIKKIESSLLIIKDSDIHQKHLNTYRKRLNLLKDIQVKATGIKEDYFQVLKEHISNLYLEDIEPDMSKIEEKNIELEVRHEYLKEEYDFFKTMTEEYNKLKNS